MRRVSNARAFKDLAARQTDAAPQLGIFQKQTGADRLSIGGALASNVHGRGLKLKPFINDVESFQLINATGEVTHCDRSSNPELFRLVIGGYGLFGVVTSVCLRLTPRVEVRRVVVLADLPDIPGNFADRIRDGYLSGDFQFATDSGLDSFMRRGVFSCYQPVDPATPLTQNPARFHPDDWARLTYYSHTHKRLAFSFYTKRYLATSGQVYYHDWQLSAAYQPDYHLELDRKMHAKTKASEMVTEIYVPRSALVNFMEEARPAVARRNCKGWPTKRASNFWFAICRPAPVNGTRSNTGCSRSSVRTGEASLWSAIKSSSISSRLPPPKRASRCAQIDANLYPLGIQVSDQQIAGLNIERDSFHGEWNYKILPKSAP